MGSINDNNRIQFRRWKQNIFWRYNFGLTYHIIEKIIHIDIFYMAIFFSIFMYQ